MSETEQKFVEVEGRMVPIVKATVEEIKREDGTVDVVVHVPCLNLKGGKNG